MAKTDERTPVAGVEIEYRSASSTKRESKPRFKRARLLDISREIIEFGAREPFQREKKLKLTIHTKTVRNVLTVEAKVMHCKRVTILRQQAYAVQLELLDIDAMQESKIAWAVAQYAPKKQSVVRREILESKVESTSDAPGTAAAPPARTKATAKPVVQATQGAGGKVQRPVALLELISKLNEFEVTHDLIKAVIEAAESNMDVEMLYDASLHHDGATAKLPEAVEMPQASRAQPINIYRLTGNATLHYSSLGLPANPPSGMFFFSGLESTEDCFAIELGLNSMAQENGRSFKKGSILVFSSTKPVENGDFGLFKIHGKDLVGQVFFAKDDIVRIRFLNPAWPEAVAKRREIRIMFKLIGVYQTF